MNSRDNSDNYICRAVTENPGYMQVKFRVPENVEIVAGEIFVPNVLDLELGYGNWDVYAPEVIEDETDIPAIILNNSFETLVDGRRPSGNPDYTQYIYREGETITGMLLLPELKFELSPDNLSNLEEFKDAMNGDITNTYLYPDLGTSSLKWTADIEEVETKVYLVIEALKWFRLGGLFGGDFAQTMVVRVKNNDMLGAPAITSFTITPEEGLLEGNANVEVGAVVANMAAQGGTEPYNYVFNDGAMGIDNASFEIEGTTIKVKDNPLTKVTDSEQKTRTSNATISVSAPEITGVTVQAFGNLTTPVNVDSKVADIIVDGGIAPYSYSLASGVGDNDLFKIYEATVEVKTQITEPKVYNITVTATDKNGKTKDGSLALSVSSPEITSIRGDLAPNLSVGNSNVSSGATVLTMTAEGGTAPITFEFKENGGESADNGLFVIDGNKVNVGSSPLTEAKEYQIYIEAKDTYNNIFDEGFDIPVLDPEITNIQADVTPELQVGDENVASGATVLTMNAEGGTAPFVYTLEENAEAGADNASFVIVDNKVNVGSNALTEAKTYKIYVKVTDSKSKTFVEGFDIPVLDPEITNIQADVTPELQVGDENVASGATVLTMNAEGGTAPFVYTLEENAEAGADNASFVIVDNKVNVGSNALTEAKTYKIYVKVTDSKSKTFVEGFDIPVSAADPEITALNITPVEGLTAPLVESTVVANLAVEGGTSPYTYILVPDDVDNAEFEISGTEVKNKAEIAEAAIKMITVEVSDSKGKTLQESASIDIT